MPLTDPRRATVRERLRPLIADDAALDALMTQFPASAAEAPATKTDLALLESSLRVDLANLETRLTDKINGVQMRLLAILLPFIVAVNAIMVALVANLR
jgi:hypothetical protein